MEKTRDENQPKITKEKDGSYKLQETQIREFELNRDEVLQFEETTKKQIEKAEEQIEQAKRYIEQEKNRLEELGKYTSRIREEKEKEEKELLEKAKRTGQTERGD